MPERFKPSAACSPGITDTVWISRQIRAKSLSMCLCFWVAWITVASLSLSVVELVVELVSLEEPHVVSCSVLTALPAAHRAFTALHTSSHTWCSWRCYRISGRSRRWRGWVWYSALGCRHLRLCSVLSYGWILQWVGIADTISAMISHVSRIRVEMLRSRIKISVIKVSILKWTQFWKGTTFCESKNFQKNHGV